VDILIKEDKKEEEITVILMIFRLFNP